MAEDEEFGGDALKWLDGEIDFVPTHTLGLNGCSRYRFLGNIVSMTLRGHMMDIICSGYWD